MDKQWIKNLYSCEINTHNTPVPSSYMNWDLKFLFLTIYKHLSKEFSFNKLRGSCSFLFYKKNYQLYNLI